MDKEKITLIVLIILFFLIAFMSNNEDNNSNKNNIVDSNVKTNKILDPLKIEIVPFADSVVIYKIINRNDYDWHNVTIKVNNYYDCTSYSEIKANTEVIFNSMSSCGADFSKNYNSIDYIEINTNEGMEVFSKQ